MNVDASPPDAQRRLERLDEARAIVAIEAQTVLNHLQNVALLRRRVVLADAPSLRFPVFVADGRTRRCAGIHARVALRLQQRQHFGFA